MPPRSANRKASAGKAKKSTPKSKRNDAQSSVVDAEETTVSVAVDPSTPVAETKEIECWIIEPEEETKPQADDVCATNVLEEEGKVLGAEEGKVIEGEEVSRGEYGIERENKGLEANCVETEVVEVDVKEEVIVEEEKNVDIAMEGNSILSREVIEEEKKMDTIVMEVNSNLNGENVIEKGDVASEERGEVEGGENESEGNENGDGTQMGFDQGAEPNSVEEETPASHFEELKALEEGGDILDVKEGGDGEGEGKNSGDDEEASEDDNEEENEDDEDDEDPSEFIHDSLTDRKIQKDLEIYIGGLDKGAVEEDLINIFGKFGEIQEARIVKNSTTKKSKGFAFIRYATVEQTKNALSELKDGIEVRGKHVKISASRDNDTLYMGNICNTWTKEKILETLKGFGIEQIEEIQLPNNPKKEGKSRGFAFLEFSTHSDAMAAFQRLRKPDAVFGHDRSAKVAFAQTPMHPNEEIISQIKTVYVEGLTDAWDEEKVKEICKQYGEIERVKLSRNLKTKRKDFGFITFSSRESALACMDGINSAQIVEGEVKVKANIARSQFRGRLQKSTRGGFKVKKESGTTEQAGSSKMKGHAKPEGAEKKSERTEQAGPPKVKGHAKSRAAEKKGKAVAQEKGKALPNSKSARGGKSNKRENSVAKGQVVGVPSNLERTNRKRKDLPSKVDGRGRRDTDHGYSRRPTKKAQGNMQGRQSNAFRNPRSNPRSGEGPVYAADSVAYRNPYALGYAASSSSYPVHAYGAIPGPKRRHSDMEPHAGYLEPAVGKRGRPLAAGYLEPAVGNQGRAHRGYVEPPLATRGQPHAGYIEPAFGNQGHDPYDYGHRRVGGYDSQGSRGSAYGAGSALPPSYVPNTTNYAGYEGGASVGDYYHSTGAYLPRRAYY